MGWDIDRRRAHCLRAVLLAASLSAIAATHIAVPVASAVPQAGGSVIDVPAGGNLQQALNAVSAGRDCASRAGRDLHGQLCSPGQERHRVHPDHDGNAALPPPGTRIDPSYKPALATIRSASTSSALSTAPGASYYRIVGVAFEANRNGSGDIIALGHADQTTHAAIPHHIELDRVVIAGDSAVGQKRAIAANASHVTIINSDIRDIKAVGQDSQAIASWNSPGPFVIRNNYLEAAGENIMFGGAHISVPGVIPSDITVEGNLLTKDPGWKGTSWTVKNVFELKNARRVVVRRNILQFTWGGAQSGFAVVLTPRNSSGQTPWVVVSDVEFSGNVVAHSGSAFNLLGHDDTRPERAARSRRHQRQPGVRHQRQYVGRHGHLRPDRRRAGRHHVRPQHRACTAATS